MGNTSSSRHSHDDTVDHGYLVPQGVYTGPQDWKHQVVAQLIVDRRLAPFYKPLEDYDPSWDSDRIIAARKQPVQQDSTDPSSHPEPPNPPSRQSSIRHQKTNSPKETPRLDEAALYKDAVECPICFLYYPSNINRSRCCDHAICTECFVQIKRTEPSPTHLSSEPACCPYCVQDNFGVTYEPPSWRAGLGSESFNSNRQEALQPAGSVPNTIRRKSFGADAPEVVTTDQIRPDWEEKLAAVKATVQRRANRRIIMRQVGDRLVPVGITSGRIHAIGQDLPGGGDGQTESRGSRRRRAERAGNGMDIAQFLGLSGQDIEELMVMEAMRLSLAEHEETQRRNDSDSNREGQSNNSTPQSSSAPAPLSYVLAGGQRPSPVAHNSDSATSHPDPPTPNSGSLQPPTVTSTQSQDSVHRSRTPSPAPVTVGEGSRPNHRKTPSAIGSLVSGAAVSAGVIAGISGGASSHVKKDNENNPVSTEGSGSLDFGSQSDEAPAPLSSSLHDGKTNGPTLSNVSAATSTDIPESYDVLQSSSSNDDSLAGMPLLTDSSKEVDQRQDRPDSPNQRTVGQPSSS